MIYKIKGESPPFEVWGDELFFGYFKSREKAEDLIASLNRVKDEK